MTASSTDVGAMLHTPRSTRRTRIAAMISTAPEIASVARIGWRRARVTSPSLAAWWPHSVHCSVRPACVAGPSSCQHFGQRRRPRAPSPASDLAAITVQTTTPANAPIERSHAASSFTVAVYARADLRLT